MPKQFWILAVRDLEAETFGVYGGADYQPAPHGIIDVETGSPMEVYGYVVAEDHDQAFDLAEQQMVEQGYLIQA